MASTTQDLAFDALGAEGYTGDLTERLMNWRTVEGLTSWETYRDYIITNGGVGSNFMDAQYAFWLAGLTSWSPLDLSPALWVDPSDASSVTISGSSGAYIGPNGLVQTATASNNTFTPDLAAHRPTGDLDLIFKVTATDWTPAVQGIFILSGTAASASNRNYYMYLEIAGTLVLARYGSADRLFTSSVATGLTNGSTKWVRATFDQDNGGQSECKFFLSDDGSAWTQLGTTQTNANVGAAPSDTTGLRIGANQTGAFPWGGTIHRAIVKNGIDGTTVFDADFETATPYVSAFTESALGAPVYVVSTTATSATASYAYVGPTGLVCPGSSANRATAPHLAAYRYSTKLELVCKIKPTVITGTYAIINKRAAGSTSLCFDFRHANNGGLELYRTTSASATESYASTSTVPYAAGVTYWARVVMDLSGGGTVKFYHAADEASEPSSWTQLGSTVATTTTTGGLVETNQLQIGDISSTIPFVGTVLRAIVRPDNVTTFDADFVTAADYVTTFTESSTNAATVTITATNTPANAAGALVSQINDLSGNIRHLVQATVANMPKYWNGQNGYNCLVFDGTNDRMTYTGTVIAAQPDTHFFAARMVSITSGRHFFDGSASQRQVVSAYISSAVWGVYAGTVLESAVASTTTTWGQFTALFNGVSSKLRRNGTQIASGNSGAGLYVDPKLGSDNTQITFSSMHFGEWFITAADNSGDTSAENYISTKWASS